MKRKGENINNCKSENEYKIAQGENKNLYNFI